MNVKKYFEEFYKTTKNPTLKAMEYFMDELGHPEKKVKIIHIAGTNGKGSVTEMLTNILVKNGYKVGKYMSPHLLEYNERISVNQKNITDTDNHDTNGSNAYYFFHACKIINNSIK